LLLALDLLEGDFEQRDHGVARPAVQARMPEIADALRQLVRAGAAFTGSFGPVDRHYGHSHSTRLDRVKILSSGRYRDAELKRVRGLMPPLTGPGWRAITMENRTRT
jgi:hypothetical protein